MKRSEFIRQIEDALEPIGIEILGITNIEVRGIYNSAHNLVASQSIAIGDGISANFMLYVPEEKRVENNA